LPCPDPICFKNGCYVHPGGPSAPGSSDPSFCLFSCRPLVDSFRCPFVVPSLCKNLHPRSLPFFVVKRPLLFFPVPAQLPWSPFSRFCSGPVVNLPVVFIPLLCYGSFTRGNSQEFGEVESFFLAPPPNSVKMPFFVKFLFSVGF